MPGDFATVEADGTITLLGRGSVCINSGGEKIFPEEVEAALKSHPDVFDAIVVGRARRALGPAGRRGRAAASGARRRRSRTPGALPHASSPATRCRRELHLVEAIVRSPSGKPDYPWAKRIAEASAAGSGSTA